MTIDMTFERREELIRIEEREEGYKAGLEDGESIGESRGESRGKQLSIIELLEDIGAVPDALKEKIMSETDSEILSKWLKLAARCDSIEEFEKNILTHARVYKYKTPEKKQGGKVQHV